MLGDGQLLKPRVAFQGYPFGVSSKRETSHAIAMYIRNTRMPGNCLCEVLHVLFGGLPQTKKLATGNMSSVYYL